MNSANADLYCQKGCSLGFGGACIDLYLVIVAWPLAETFRLSFTDARLGGETYIGFENYVDLA